MASVINASVSSNGIVSTADASGILQIQSNGVNTNAQAWVNFNGTSGASPVIRASYNISSVTRNGTGDYTINFTNAFADANYSAVFGGQGSTGATAGYLTGKGNNSTVQQTASALPVYGINGANANIDLLICSVAVFR
jgi:hypothetical protein